MMSSMSSIPHHKKDMKMATNTSSADMETLKNQVLFGGTVIVTALATLCLDMPVVLAIPMGAAGGCFIGFSLVYLRVKNNESKRGVGEQP